MASSSETTKSKSRLGRGLSSLLSLQEAPVQATVPPDTAGRQTDAPGTLSGDAGVSNRAPSSIGLIEIAIEQVAANPHQPRRDFDEQGLADLASSLKSNGVIQPVVVKRVGTGYELIAGERRLRAARIAGLATIPAIVRDADSFAQAQMALVENIQRTDLNPIDRAHAYQNLMQNLGLTQAELAMRLGEDRSGIANYLRLLELDDHVADLVRDGKISLGHAKMLAAVEDRAEQLRLAELVVNQDLSVRNLERLLVGAPKAKPPTRRALSAHMKEVERQLSSQLGLRVQMRGAKGGKGRVTIHYQSLDQFDELVNRLGVKLDSE